MNRLYLLALPAAFVLAACCKDDPSSDTSAGQDIDPAPSGPELVIGQTDFTLGALDNTGTTITFTSNVDWKVEVICGNNDPRWLTVNTSDGPAGEHEIEISAYRNSRTDWRQAYVDIVYADRVKRLSVIQRASDANENLAPYFAPEFAQWLVKNGYLSSAEYITQTDVAGITEIRKVYGDTSDPPADLRGIEFFENLEQCLYVDSGLTALDLSQNTKLTELYCNDNKLTSLNVSGCSSLAKLECYNNSLQSLDLRGCTALEMLDCKDNELASLDISPCPVLMNLTCSSNRLTGLDISKNRALVYLALSNNQVASLDVRGFASLEDFYCAGNQLSVLDLSGCAALTKIDCSSNQLTELNVCDCTLLTSLICGNNSLTTLETGVCPDMIELICPYNQLASLDISTCTGLSSLILMGNPGDGEIFPVMVWADFDTDNIPKGFSRTWQYEDRTITAEYHKAE